MGRATAGDLLLRALCRVADDKLPRILREPE